MRRGLRDYDNSALGHVVAAGTVGFQVETDHARFGHLVAGVDDRPADTAITADLDTGHEDRILHFTITVYTDARGKNAVQHPTSGDDRAGADHRIDGHPH